jgi:GWxTD domain-containing protein
MNRRGTLSVLASLLLLSSLSAAAQQRNPRPQQPSESRQRELENRALRKWLEEDAAYIISDEEKAAFKALRTDEEREQFIEQFWLRRDPTPDTFENEFKEEHYERIAYANERFSSGKPGWKTDRGRIYIVHGKPHEQTYHSAGSTYDRPYEEGGGSTQIYATEFWTYRYIEGIGNNVVLEFVDPSGSGEFRLTIDPSEKDMMLHIPGAGLTLEEEMNGGDKSNRFSRTDGTHLGSGSGLGYNQFDRLALYANIFKPPEVKFKDLEAIVTTKMSFNLLPFRYKYDFVRVTEQSVLTPVTITLDHKDLAFQDQQGIHTAEVNVYGRITGINGRLAQQFEDTIRQQIPTALFQKALESGSIYQKTVPLPPGLYKLDLVLKDINSGNVGTINTSLRVPRIGDDRIAISSVILADLVEEVPANQIGSGSFIFGATKVRPNVKEEFRRDNDLKVWFQVYNLKVDEATHKPSATVEMLITRNGQQVAKVTEESTEVSNAAQQMTVWKAIPLVDFEPGQYSIQVKVTDNLTKEVTSQTGKFAIR